MQSLSGVYERLAEKQLDASEFDEISRWSMNYVRNETNHHEVALVKDLKGTYRVCLTGFEGSEENGVFHWVAVRVNVDGIAVPGFNGNVASYRHGNCVDVTGSTISIAMNSWSPGLQYFHLEGSLYRDGGGRE